MVSKLTLLLQLVVVAFAAQQSTLVANPPSNLLLEYLPSPVLGVDVALPRFSWTDQTSAPQTDVEQSQYAYQIQVSLSPSVPSGDIWDSGIVVSNQSVLVPYAGRTLLSDTSYYWKVRWWNQDKVPSAYSYVAQFDTSLLTNSDWRGAAWLSGYNQFRTEFSIPGKVTRARAYVSGAGYYELYLNGNKVGNYVLDISWTNYVKRVMYTTYDVTAQLKQGANAVGLMLGNGWWGQGDKGEKMGIFLLSVEYSGSTQKFYVVSNSSWTGINGPITADSIYNGETYDANMETPGWTSPGYTQKWNAPTVKSTGPGGVLRSTMIPPIKILETFAAQKMTQPQHGVYVYDFGQNFSGWCKLKVKGPKGTTIRLRHAEILDHDGSGMIYTANLRSAKATDYYTLKGDTNGEEYQPRFTYHGFRFVELTGFTGTPTLETLTALHLFSSVPPAGSIGFSNPILTQIQHNIIYGQQSNFMSVPTDCDQRDERLGWMGDAQLSAEEAFHNFEVGSFYSHFVHLINDDEGTDGTVTDTVPYLRYGSRPADPAWGAAYPLLVYWVHSYKGDIRILQEEYDGVKGWMDYLTGRVSQSGLANMYSFYGDWVPPPPEPKCSGSLTSAFYYLLNINQLADMANTVGNKVDANKYSEIYRQNVIEFNKAFYKAGTNSYGEGVQTCLVLPLFLGIQPNNNVVNTLLNDVVSSHKNHLTTGIIGTKYLPLALSKYGRTDVALALALQTTYPSWAYMFTQKIETPATTLWELWDSPSEGPGMNSRNHIMFGSVGAWFYQYLAGIRQSPSTVGFSNTTISPPDANVLLLSPISTVSATLSTPYGLLSSTWTRSGATQCRQIYPNYDLDINCGEQGGVITKIDVETSCRNTLSVQESCYRSSDAFVKLEQLCVGKQECKLDSDYSNLFMADCNEAYDMTQMYVVATCSAAAGLSVSATVPVNSVAEIHVNKLNNADVTITDKGKVVFQNGKFVDGPGIKSVSTYASEVVFNVGSGQYNFQATGTTGEYVCVSAQENAEFSLSCPGNSKVSVVKFASYGTTKGGCETLVEGHIHAGCSVNVVEQMCLHKNSCQFQVDAALFGIEKNDNHVLSVSAYCS